MELKSKIMEAKTTIKLTKKQKELFETLATYVIKGNGKKLYFLPYILEEDTIGKHYLHEIKSITILKKTINLSDMIEQFEV